MNNQEGKTIEYQRLAPRFPFLRYKKIPESKLLTKILYKVVERKVFTNCYPVSYKSGNSDNNISEDKEITMEWNCFPTLPTIDDSAIDKMAEALKSSINIPKMGDTTKEEQESIDTYIKKHSTATGIILANDSFVNDVNRIIADAAKRRIDADIMKELYAGQMKGDLEDARQE